MRPNDRGSGRRSGPRAAAEQHRGSSRASPVRGWPACPGWPSSPRSGPRACPRPRRLPASRSSPRRRGAPTRSRRSAPPTSSALERDRLDADVEPAQRTERDQHRPRHPRQQAAVGGRRDELARARAATRSRLTPRARHRRCRPTAGRDRARRASRAVADQTTCGCRSRPAPAPACRRRCSPRCRPAASPGTRRRSRPPSGIASMRSRCASVSSRARCTVEPSRSVGSSSSYSSATERPSRLR